MLPKFYSKEVHFLKTDSDLTITPPDHFFCDLISSRTGSLTRFKNRLQQTKIPGNRFLCATMELASDIPDPDREKVKTTFENTFNLVLDNERGIWEYLGDLSFIIAFWDNENTQKASELMVSLKNKMSGALKSSILVGVARFPFHDFTRSQTVDNAIKAIDHAAFFGPDTLIHFDGVSLNISGDRFYQTHQFEMARTDYLKGLEIKPNDINLINSLGVCYGVAGELENARTEFERALKINAKEVMVIYNLGLIHRIEEDLDKAILYLRKARAINDRIFEVELLLGHLLFLKGLHEQALPHLETAIQIDDTSAAAFRLKGEILLADRQPDEAAKAFNRAIKINPSDATSLSGYAKCLEIQNKNLTIALSFAKNSIALEPDNTLFQQRLNTIREKIDGLEPPEQIKTA